MSRILSIALFVLLAEAAQAWLYFTLAAHDLAKIGLLGPLAGALAGSAVATLLEQLWRRLPPLARNVIFISIVVFCINAGTTYYQCYAEQITHDARVLHPQAEYTSGAWGDDPWMMYPELANAGFGTGCAHLTGEMGASVVSTLEMSFIWLPIVMLICWFTTGRPASSWPQVVDARTLSRSTRTTLARSA